MTTRTTVHSRLPAPTIRERSRKDKAMLVITRRPRNARPHEDRAIIDTPCGRLEVVLVSVKGSAVRIGFIAPQSFRISRAELAGDYLEDVRVDE